MNESFECFTVNNELWVRTKDGNSERVTERSLQFITFMLTKIQDFYPKAYAALEKEYSKCKPNMQFFHYRMVLRFCKCNFGAIDMVDDVDDFGGMNLESVQCPRRGECQGEGIICMPEFDSHISPAEKRVLKLWYQGRKKEEIATELYLSYYTVCNHIRNAFTRLNIHDKGEFVRYADKNHLFE